MFEQRTYDFGVVTNTMKAVSGDVQGVVEWAQAVADIDLAGATAVDPVSLSNAIEQILSLVAGMDRPHLLQRMQGYAMLVLPEADFRRVVELPQINYDFGVMIEAATYSPTVAELEDWKLAVIADVPLGRQLLVEVVQFVLDHCQAHNRPHLLARFGAMIDLLSADGQVLDSGAPLVGDGLDPLLLLP